MPDSAPLARVLMTADTIGGVWDYSLQLAESLGMRGVAVTLATMGAAPTRDQAMAAAGVPGLELISRECRLEWMDDPWADVDAAGEWLLDLEEDVSPDIIHLNGYAHGSLPWRAPVLVVGHSCVCSWWDAVHGRPAPVAWNSYRERVRAGLFAADAVAAPSRTMAGALARHYGRLDVSVIPNGRDPRYFSPGPKGTFVLCAARAWDPAKNVRLLASAGSRLPWPVYVAGDTAPDDSTWDADCVHLLGRLASPVLRQWLACASIYVLPAKYEPFGLSALEAALCQCALVLGDIPSLRENWDGAATFVPTDDPEALAFCLSDLAAGPDRLSALALRAYERALTLSPDRMADAYMELYGRLLREPVPVRRPRGDSSCAW